MQKKQKLKITSRDKSYRLEDSPFFKLRSRKKLATLLSVTLKKLESLTDNCHYHRFTHQQGDKIRNIHQLDYQLDRVHTRIASLLVRIAPPDYLHSGIKGRSNISNARAHLKSSRLITCDLKAFFDSTTRKQIFSFFYKDMQCSSDVANLLSYVICVDDHCPTGSRLSMLISFYANKQMFDELALLSEHNGITMTLYVDDLTFSGHKAKKCFVPQVNRIIQKFGHNLKKRKTKAYEPNSPKLVTGVIISNGQLKPRNAHLKSLSNSFLQYRKEKANENIDPKLRSRIAGILSYLGQINPIYRKRARSFTTTEK